jgi:hypothetical protein
MNGKFWTLAAVLTVLFAERPAVCRAQAATVGAPTAYPGADKILVPNKGWPCGRPGGIPVPERGTPVFEATMALDHVYDVGRTPYGPRKVYVSQAGTVTGAKLSGTVMSGGLDFELSFSNGAMEIEEIFVLRATNGSYLYLHSAGTAADPSDVRMVPDFEAPNNSAFNWLNTGEYAGRRVVDVAAKTLKITVWEVPSLGATADAANSVPVTKPPDVKDQPWDYRRAAPGERRGGQLINENVTLAPSQQVGPAKNHNRNIIPITGGTLTGKITGKVLAGGADYQNLANPMTIDARYLWQTSEGDVIIVRNAGPFMSLTPIFEVRLDSQYAWLNDGKYLSSSPGMGAGGVGLNFFESTQ